MNGTIEAFNQKVKLIYEYNNKSPLFVRLAGIEIEKNNLDRAETILSDGLVDFPQFAIAYFLIGKIHTLKGNYSKAISFFKMGSELIYSPRSFEYYLREIETIKKQRSFFNINRWIEFANETHSSGSKPDTDETVEETLLKLTKEIEGATQSIKEAKDKIEKSKLQVNLPENLVLSETLAQIYANQNEIQAAISVYKKLIKKNPGKENYFNSKIEELKSLLKT